jgi:hypothetical protein
MQMASLHHIKCPQLENFCGLSVIIYWYLTEPTHRLVYKDISPEGFYGSLVEECPPFSPSSIFHPSPSVDTSA